MLLVHEPVALPVLESVVYCAAGLSSPAVPVKKNKVPDAAIVGVPAETVKVVETVAVLLPRVNVVVAVYVPGLAFPVIAVKETSTLLPGPRLPDVGVNESQPDPEP